MSAPNYTPSNDETIVHGNGKSSHAGGSGSAGHDDELHRYVTDDQPRQGKMGIAEGAGAPPRQIRGKPAEGLIVSLPALFWYHGRDIADHYQIVQPLKKNE